MKKSNLPPRRNNNAPEINPKNQNQHLEIKNKQNINNDQLKKQEINNGRNTPRSNKETPVKNTIEQKKQMFENKQTNIKKSAVPVKGVSKEIEQRKQMFENNNSKNNPVSANKIMIKKVPNEQNKNEKNNNININPRVNNRYANEEIEQKKHDNITNNNNINTNNNNINNNNNNINNNKNNNNNINNNKNNNNNNNNHQNIPYPSNIKIRKDIQTNKQNIENNNPTMNDTPRLNNANKNENDKNKQISQSSVPNNNHLNKISIKKNEENKPNLDNNNLKNNQLENKNINKENQPINNNINNIDKNKNQIVNDPNQFPMNNKPSNTTSENKSEKKAASLSINDINTKDNLKNKTIKNTIEKEQKGINNLLKTNPYPIIIKTENEKEDIKPIIEKNNTDINRNEKQSGPIIPMLNSRGTNNCFINVLVQILYHSPEFRNEYLKINFKDDPNNPLYQLQLLFKKYQHYQKDRTPRYLDIRILRKTLSKIFTEIQDSVCGDPVEVLNDLLNAIHLFQVDHKTLNDFNASQYKCKLTCLSHQFFSIKLQETMFCQNCEAVNDTSYDDNYFVFEIFVYEILEKLHSKTNQSFRNKLFSYAKEINTTVPENTKLSKCTCDKPNNIKKLTQLGNYNPYLVINLTWVNPIPKMTDACKIFNLIPLYATNIDLFNPENEGKKKDYYLYAIILYYYGHYTCAVNSNNIWYFIDDTSNKRFESYKDLIINAIHNHYHPVILFYSNYIKYPELDKDQVFHSEEYNKIYKFCYDFDQSKGLDVSNAIKKSSILLRKSSNKINQAIEYVNNSKRSSKISSSTISSGEGWRCLYCKNKNKNDMIKCWNCKRPRNIMQTIRDSNNNIKGNSGLFLNDIPLVNSIRDGSNLKDNIEFFFDKRNSSIDVLKSLSFKKKNDTDDNEININDNYLSTINQEPKNLQKNARKNVRMNSSKQNTSDNEFSIFNKSNFTWTCKNCHNVNNDNFNFCPKCGLDKRKNF